MGQFWNSQSGSARSPAMSNHAPPRRLAASHHTTQGPSNTPRVEAQWEKPLIATNGGEATLLVRVIAATENEIETSRAAPLDVAFVLDRSGSMQGGKLDLAKAGVDLAVARLR